MFIRRIAIFASGSGTNAQNIMEYFAGNKKIVVDSLFSNRHDAYAIERAKGAGIEVFVFSKEELYHSDCVLELLKNRGITLIVLAGFLWLIPENLISNFKIINIHPALLPKYGGKGMYGQHVHESVVKNGDKESGITIHYVNEKYDEGAIIFQAKCEIFPGDSASDVAQKVHKLEYQHYPRVIEMILTGLPEIS